MELFLPVRVAYIHANQVADYQAAETAHLTRTIHMPLVADGRSPRQKWDVHVAPRGEYYLNCYIYCSCHVSMSNLYIIHYF